MKVQHFTDTPAESFPEIEGVTIRWVINSNDGAPNFAMRVIDVQPGKNTPFHTHGFEHEVFVLEGEGIIRSGSSEKRLSPGTVVFVSPDEEHGFFNAGGGVLRFICVIPHPVKART